MTATETFRKLHAAPGMLVLANAWDAGSARLIESVGARAIATTSAGVAWARGYPDGDALPIDLLLATAREIARVVRVPVTIDIEGGYSDDPAAVGDLATRLIDAGVVGINVEDGGGTPELLAAKIEVVRRSASRAGVDLFINARCDVYLRGIESGEAAVAEIARRAARYRQAGCDGLFAPCIVEAADIKAVASCRRAARAQRHADAESATARCAPRARRAAPELRLGHRGSRARTCTQAGGVAPRRQGRRNVRSQPGLWLGKRALCGPMSA
jgi:2-methylisocitrate lyase-like PEP mutase family enzyme